MSGLRNQKNTLRNSIYALRDELITGIEDKIIEEEKAKLLHKKILDMFQEFRVVCEGLHEEWEVFKEIDKQARLNAEYNQVSSAVDDSTKLVQEYEDYIRERQASLSSVQKHKSKLSKERKAVTASVDQQINELISHLENSIAEISQQQKGIFEKLASPKDSSFELPIKTSETEHSTRHPEWLIPDVEKKAQSIFGQEKKFSRSRSSTPKVSTVTGNDGHVAQQPHSMLTEEDPLTGLTRLSIPKFKGDKRMFESWYASFYQIVGKYKKVPPEQKLLRLYSCLEGEALLTIQNLGYSAAAYDVAIARLIRKYGGKRRELTMRLEELDKFRGVRMGNANDLERFAELLDTLMVKLCDAGQDGELGAGSLYVSLLRKLNEQLVVKYQDWLREKHLEGNVRNLHAFVNDEAESWMVALETVRGLGQQKTKVFSAGSTLAVTQVSVKKKSVPLKCKVCSKDHGLWLCEQFKALPVDQRWEKARELRVCFSCLSHSHRSSTCRRAKRCPIVGCSSNHHRLLHKEVNQRMPMAVSPNPNVAERPCQCPHQIQTITNSACMRH